MLANLPTRLRWGLSLIVLAAPPALAETAKMADSFVDSIGVNMHVGGGIYSSAWAAIQNAMANSGIRHVRDYIWDQATFNMYVQPLINQFHAATGLDLKYMLTQQAGCTPTSANPMGVINLGLSPATNVFGFEGLNEWNGWGAKNCPNWSDDDRNFQQYFWNTVRGTPAIASLPVIGPSMGEWGGNGLTKQEQVTNDANVVGNLTAYMDYGNIHNYCTSSKPSCDFSWHPTALNGMNGTKSVIVTETGWTNGDVNQAIANNYFSRLFFEWFNYGATQTYVYELMDEPSKGSWEGSFGLLNSDGSYKPAMTTISNFIAILKDPGASFTPGTLNYTSSGGPDALHHTLLQKRNGTFYLVLWLEYNYFDTFSPATVTVNFSDMQGQIDQYDPLTSSNPKMSWSNVSSVELMISDGATILAISR
jgi:hypothetical protein